MSSCRDSCVGLDVTPLPREISGLPFCVSYNLRKGIFEIQILGKEDGAESVIFNSSEL